MSHPDQTVAIVGDGIAAHVAASTAAERGLRVILLAEGNPDVAAIWNGLGSIFGPASRLPLESAGTVERKTSVAAPFDPTREARWQRLMSRRPGLHPYARLELSRPDVDDLVAEALDHLPGEAFERTPSGTVVPGPHGQPYAADIWFPSIRHLDLRSDQRIGLLRHPDLSGWNADALATQLSRASGLEAVAVETDLMSTAPPGHGVRSARWLEDQWKTQPSDVVRPLQSVIEHESLDVLALPPIVGSTLSAHRTIWSRLTDELPVPVAEVPPSADPVFGWRLFEALRTLEPTDRGSGEFLRTPGAEEIEVREKTAVSVTDRSGQTHRIDALVLANGRWFGGGLPGEAPMRAPLLRAPVWLDGAPLPDDPELYPPDFLDDLPWADHQLFRAGLQIDPSGRILDRDAEPFANVFGAGRLLAGFNPFHDGCSMGVELVTGRLVGRTLACDDSHQTR